jgi:hypothetical protein
MIPGGPGPWFCCLLFNTSTTKCKKQTHLIAHTLPHLAVDVLNKASPLQEKSDCWVAILKIGPFEKWCDCVSFLQLWTNHTRGKLRRLERGMELFYAYHQQYQLRAWLQSKTRDETVAEHESGGGGGEVVGGEEEDVEENEGDDNEASKNNQDQAAALFAPPQLMGVFGGGGGGGPITTVRMIKDAHIKLQQHSSLKRRKLSASKK